MIGWDEIVSCAGFIETMDAQNGNGVDKKRSLVARLLRLLLSANDPPQSRPDSVRTSHLLQRIWSHRSSTPPSPPLRALTGRLSDFSMVVDYLVAGLDATC